MKAGLMFSGFLVAFFLFAPTKMIGQNTQSNINITQEVADLVDRKVEINKEVFASQYYAIQLYYGNYTAAQNILNAFKVSFPDWETELSFETPNYKVRVGRFKNLIVANQKLEEIRKTYPSAFLLEPNNL